MAAEKSTLQVEVVSTTEVLWQGEARQISIPGVEGRLGILPGRQPILVLLQAGQVQVTKLDGEQITLDVPAGFCSCDQDEVTICVDGG